MDLKCFNNHEGINYPNNSYAMCNVSLMKEDSKEWIFYRYEFSFYYENEIYYLHAFNFFIKDYNYTILYKLKIYKPLIKLPYFISLSTGDDMHEEAWELFHRLRKLAAFV
jgi:hypothetical protein